MTLYEFTFVLEQTLYAEHDAEVERIYGRCDDSSIVTSEHVTRVHFGRKAKSLFAAVQSALADLRAEGFEVRKVEFDTEAFEAATPVAA